MLLPGRLRTTSLGDLLGVLHRASVTGTLELVEDRGRTHRVHLSRGLVVAVEIDGAAPSLAEILRLEHAADADLLRRSLLRAIASRRLHGEVLVEDFRVAPEVVSQALRRQLLRRLAALDGVADARVCFRVAVRPPRGAFRDRPLEPREFLHGRRRARERSGGGGATSRDVRAWHVLGLTPGVDESAVRRAYRRLAREVHPDLHPGASDEERRALQARFVEITEAYRALVA
ncbi:MAG TPA: DnaJ domain-containing protein [Polyangiaceae bacterium]|nr:DnaJ domain-containing protein [Polyangiaceae bacterium]